MALAGFDDAPVFDRLPGWELGTYVAEVIRFEKYEGYETKKDPDLPDKARAWYFKGEYRVVEAMPGSVNKVGDVVADVIPLHGEWKVMFYGKAKSMLGAAADEDPRSIKEVDIDEATTPDQAFKGRKVSVYVVKAQKQKKPTESFNRATYTPYKPTETASATPA